jgi:hypothetical protein
MRLVGVLVLCACVLLAGCQVSTSERVVMSSKRDAMRKARFDGEYRLYHVETGAAPEMVFSRRLEKGQSFGFRRGHANRVAVAGPHEFALDGRRFEWRMAADEGQVDAVLTTMLLVTGAAIGTAIGFAAFNSSFDFDFGPN